MATSSNPIIPKDGTITIIDATGTPLSFVVIYEDGDIQMNGLAKDQKQVVAFKDRGAVYALRETEDIEAVEISFTAHLVGFTDASVATLVDCLLKRGPVWASAVSTLGAAYGGGTNGVMCHDITWGAERSDYGATADASIGFKYFHCDDVSFSDGIPAKVAIKGRAFRMAHDTVAWMRMT